MAASDPNEAQFLSPVVGESIGTGLTEEIVRQCITHTAS
jgi:hypothetical protein